MRNLVKRAVKSLVPLTLFVSSVPLAAQARGDAPTRIPVTVAIVDELPGADLPYALLRRTAAQGGDVILLPPSADADLLSGAVRALLAVRRQQGDWAEESGRLRVTSRASRRPAFLWAARVLGDIRRAERQLIPGVGTLPSVVIWLPPQRRSQRVPMGMVGIFRP